MTSRRILNILRSLFLFTSLICAGITLFWPQVFSQLSKADWVLVQFHTRKHQTQFDDAKELLKTGDRSGALRKLANLADGLSDVRRGDRLSPMRTKALDMLGDLHHKDGSHAEALKWTEELLAYDPRDFVSMMRRSELLLAMGDSDGSFDQLQAAFLVGSVSGVAQLRYMEALCERGMREKLAVTLLELGARGPLGVALDGWEFRCAESPDAKFTPRMPLPLKKKNEKGEYEASIEVPSNTGPDGTVTAGLIRIDMPAGALLAMDRFKCIMRRSDDSTAEFTDMDMGHIHHIVLERDDEAETSRWLPTGDIDPYFVVQPKPLAPVTDIVRFYVIMELHPHLPEKARELLAEPFDPALRASWIERFGAESVAALESFHE